MIVFEKAPFTDTWERYYSCLRFMSNKRYNFTVGVYIRLLISYVKICSHSVYFKLDEVEKNDIYRDFLI